MPDPAIVQNHCLETSVDSGIGRIIMNRPERKNALNLASWRALAQAIADLAAKDARVIVITGAGADFCAGADISEFDEVRRDGKTARIYEAANSEAFAAIRNAPVPVIATIRGICFGGGFGIAAAADLRIAAPDARFAVPAAKLGLAYPQDAMVDIVTSAGAQMARYLTYTAAHVDATRALACGFLLEVVEPAGLVARGEEIATHIATNAPLSVRASKLAIGALQGNDAAAGEFARNAGDLTFDSADYAEGRAAFKERRTPRFTGR